jgi:cobalamin biosynthesis protein CobD/CbiB
VKNKKGHTIYSEPVKFGHPMVAHGKVYVWLSRRLFKARYRKGKVVWSQMPCIITAWIDRYAQVVDMNHQSLQ